MGNVLYHNFAYYFFAVGSASLFNVDINVSVWEYRTVCVCASRSCIIKKRMKVGTHAHTHTHTFSVSQNPVCSQRSRNESCEMREKRGN